MSKLVDPITAAAYLGSLVRQRRRTGSPFSQQELREIVTAARSLFTDDCASLIELLVKQLGVTQ